MLLARVQLADHQDPQAVFRGGAPQLFSPSLFVLCMTIKMSSIACVVQGLILQELIHTELDPSMTTLHLPRVA